MQVESVAIQPVSDVVSVIWMKLLGVLTLMWIVLPLWVVPPLLVVLSLSHQVLISSRDIYSQEKEGIKASASSLNIYQFVFQAPDLTLLVLILIL